MLTAVADEQHLLEGFFVFFFQCNSLEDDLSFTESLVFWKSGSVIDLSQNCGAAKWLGYHHVAGQKRTHARRWQLCAPERSLSVCFTKHLTVAAGKRVNTENTEEYFSEWTHASVIYGLRADWTELWNLFSDMLYNEG